MIKLAATHILLAVNLSVATSSLQATPVEYRLGNDTLGVRVVGDATYSNSDGHHKAALTGQGEVTVLSMKGRFAEGKANLDVTRTSARLTGSIKAFGSNLLTLNQSLATNTAKSVSTAKFTRSVSMSATILRVGPCSLSVDLSTGVTAFAEATLTTQVGTADRAISFKLVAGPVAEASATGALSLTASIIVASAKLWVDGSVSWKKSVLASLEGDFATKRLKWGAEFDSWPLTGKIAGHARIKIAWLIRKTFNKTFIEFGGGEPKVATLFSQSVRL